MKCELDLIEEIYRKHDTIGLVFFFVKKTVKSLN